MDNLMEYILAAAFPSATQRESSGLSMIDVFMTQTLPLKGATLSNTAPLNYMGDILSGIYRAL